MVSLETMESVVADYSQPGYDVVKKIYVPLDSVKKIVRTFTEYDPTVLPDLKEF